MPRLTYFYGISIYLYYEDHPPPHVHARYSGHEARIAIRDGDIIEGFLPNRAQHLVAEWVSLHSEDRRVGAGDAGKRAR